MKKKNNFHWRQTMSKQSQLEWQLTAVQTNAENLNLMRLLKLIIFKNQYFILWKNGKINHCQCNLKVRWNAELELQWYQIWKATVFFQRAKICLIFALKKLEYCSFHVHYACILPIISWLHNDPNCHTFFYSRF